MGKAVVFWTDEKIEKMEALISEHASAGFVAHVLGCSRSAAIGKASRLGMTFHSGANGPTRARGALTIQRRSPRPRLVKSPEDVARLAIEPEALGPQNNFPTTNCCRWIHGDPKGGDWQCCAQPGFPWCEHHASRMFMQGYVKPSREPVYGSKRKRAA